MFHVNSVALGAPVYSGRSSVFEVLDDQVLLPPVRKVTGTAAAAAATPVEDGSSAVVDLGSLKHLESASVPPLDARTAFALRRLGAGKFADIWIAVRKAALQGWYCRGILNECLLVAMQM